MCVGGLFVFKKIISWSEAPPIFVFRIQLPSSMYTFILRRCIHLHSPIAPISCCFPLWTRFQIENSYFYMFICELCMTKTKRMKRSKKKRKKKNMRKAMSNKQAHAISVCGGVVGHTVFHSKYIYQNQYMENSNFKVIFCFFFFWRCCCSIWEMDVWNQLAKI